MNSLFEALFEKELVCGRLLPMYAARRCVVMHWIVVLRQRRLRLGTTNKQLWPREDVEFAKVVQEESLIDDARCGEEKRERESKRCAEDGGFAEWLRRVAGERGHELFVAFGREEEDFDVVATARCFGVGRCIERIDEGDLVEARSVVEGRHMEGSAKRPLVVIPARGPQFE